MKSFSYPAMRLPFPTPWHDLFERSAPLIVEIGFGDGMFLVDLAKQNPDINFIGIEHAHNPMTWTEKRVRREKIDNVRLIFGDAFMSLHCLFEPSSVRTFHINFSDPWHKKRHHERRLIDADFLAVLVSRLEVPGGELFIATDIENYVHQIQIALAITPGIQNAYETAWRDERENPSVITRYENKAIQEGRICHYFKWWRSADPVPAISIYQEEEMPNAILYVPLDLETIASRFEKTVIRNQDRIVSFKAIYRHLGNTALLIEAVIDEPLFAQHLMILIRERNDHEYLVRMAEVGYPRATPGTQDAVGYIAGWLLMSHPDSRVIEQKVKIPSM